MARKETKTMKRKGFTLIELLVVIAIIGLLSTLAVVSLNSARSKARDAKRLSDMKTMSTAIELSLADTGAGGYDDVLLGCVTKGARTTTCTDLLQLDFGVMTDPSALGAGAVCTNLSADVCDYALGIVPTVSNYEVCFYLENASGSLSAGINKISAGGVMSGGCSN